MTKDLNNKDGMAGVEEVLEEVVDLEEYAREGKQPPLSRGYRIRINGEQFVVSIPNPTGREILTLAGLLPAENYTLRIKYRRREAAQGRAGRKSRSAQTRRREVQGAAAGPDGGGVSLRRQFELAPGG